jgi:hypothetical protein
MYESPVTVITSAARTASGQSASLQCGQTPVIALLANVTAVSGTTPTLTISVEWSPDGGSTWASADPVDAFTQITAATNVAKQFRCKSNVYRVVFTIGGTTPSFTFSVREYDLGA